MTAEFSSEKGIPCQTTKKRFIDIFSIDLFCNFTLSLSPISPMPAA